MKRKQLPAPRSSVQPGKGIHVETYMFLPNTMFFFQHKQPHENPPLTQTQSPVCNSRDRYNWTEISSYR